jgi:poly-gamma-glutamate synthesis protein (capsule biosynthesis protein)
VSPATPAPVRIGIVGDVMLGRRVGERAGRDGAAAVTARVDELLAGPDIVCGNLEAPFSSRPASPSCLSADPSAVVALRRVHAVSLANNHMGDCGDDGVAETLKTLRAAGIAAFGIGRDEEEALAPVVLEPGGLRVALIGCCAAAQMPSGVSGHAFGALESAALPRAIAAAREAADVVVVHVHAGNEQVPYPPPSLRARLLELAGAGADVVVTHHPHVVGGWERSGPALIWHGLGDFVFDGDTPARCRAGMLTVDAGRGGVTGFALVPTHMTDDLRVAPAPPAVAAAVEAGVERVRRALAEPDYAARYRRRFVGALARAQLDRVVVTYRRDGLSPAVRKGARLALFAPSHALRLVSGRFR